MGKKFPLKPNTIQTMKSHLAPVWTILFFVSFHLMTVRMDKVKLDVHYETLCPDSIRFMMHQLILNYETIASMVQLNLIPFGKAEVRSWNRNWTSNLFRWYIRSINTKIHPTSIVNMDLKSVVETYFILVHWRNMSTTILKYCRSSIVQCINFLQIVGLTLI